LLNIVIVYSSNAPTSAYIQFFMLDELLLDILLTFPVPQASDRNSVHNTVRITKFMTSVGLNR